MKREEEEVVKKDEEEKGGEEGGALCRDKRCVFLNHTSFFRLQQTAVPSPF